MANSYVLPKGRVYFDPFDPITLLPTGERALGNCPGFEISVTSESLEHFSSESGIREKDDEAILSVTRNAVINCDNMAIENMALFIIGGLSVLSQGAASVTNHGLTVIQGRTYRLGVSAGFPLGARNVSAVVVTGTGGTPTYVAGTDYELNAIKGTITIIVGGGIADDTVLEVDFTKAAKTWTQVASQSLTALTGALRFEADNPKGPNRDLYAPKANLKPNGSFPFIGETWQALSLNAEFLKRDANTAQLYIEDSPVV